MAPEAFDGKRNAQTDIWSVGVIFYQLLAGRLPFPQADITSLVGAILTRNPDPLPLSIPITFHDITNRALAKDPSQRFRSVAEMRAALRNPTAVSPKVHPEQKFINTFPASPADKVPSKSPPPQSKRRSNPHLIYAFAGLFAVLIIVIGIVSLLKPSKDTSSPNTNISSSNPARTQTTPISTNVANHPSRPSGIMDELNGSSIGDTYGITYTDAIDGQGAIFSRENESRIQFRDIPGEGTLEWWINVRSGYIYSDYKLSQNQPTALIFTTVGPDVWYPGSAFLYASSDGKLSLNMATTKYDGPTQLLIAPNTNFRFNQWHSIGVSFGSNGQYIMLDGVLVASAPQNKQKLGRGGTHDSSVDIPTIGELASGYWENNRYEAGFEGIVDRFRISNKQQDWYLSARSPDKEMR